MTRISVVALACAIAAAPTSVLPAPQGSTTTPEPPCQKPSTASLLVGPQRPAVLVEVDRVRLAVDVAGEVLGRPAELEQLLLEVAALGGVHDDACRRRCASPSSGLIFLCRSDLLEHRRGRCVRSTRPCVGCFSRVQPAVAVHRLGDVDEQRVRDGVAAVA